MALEEFSAGTPINTSLFQSAKFTFIIPNKPFLKYFLQTIQLPAISTSQISIAGPHSAIKLGGEKITFEPLMITALLDEDMRVYEETQKWLYALGRPMSDSQYPKVTKQNYLTQLFEDAYLTSNTNANNPNIRYKFVNVHPTSIGMVNFDTKIDADTMVTCDFTFDYDYFEIIRLTQ